jgi:serine/threonine protein kinase
MDAPQHDHDFEAPTIEELAPLFPAYEIGGFVAQGGMGAVYHARQKSLDRPVAIKILPREFGSDGQFRTSFEAEAKAMAKLNHPNLLAVYDFGAIDGMLFIIMELVEGKSLHHSAHGIAIEQKEAARLVSGICRGLAHAHQAGILHRDIKPANILLTTKVEPKIGDFGLARPVGQAHGADETIFGTPGYSAPEVLHNPNAVDQRTDIYAVGIILYELLTGQLPPDPWQPPSTLVRTDPGFDAIARRATHPSPELGYVDANELADELDELAKRLRGKVLQKKTLATPGAAAPAPTTAALGRPALRPTLTSRKSSNFPVWAVVLLLTAFAGIFLFIALNGDKREAPATPPKPPPLVGTPSPKPKEPKPVTPKPKPRPKPVDPEPPVIANNPPAPEPAPQPGPDVTPDPEPAPDPEPTKPKPPEFDVAGFVDKGRTGLQQKADYIFAQHRNELLDNIKRFERAANRLARKFDRNERNAAETYIEELVAECVEAERIVKKNRPEKTPKNLKGFLDDFQSIYLTALSEQVALEEKLVKDVTPLRDSYYEGLIRKAEALSKAGDTDSETILREEADRALKSMPRFLAILKREDIPAGAPSSAESDPLVGAWTLGKTETKVNFAPDGTVSNSLFPIPGTWTREEDKYVVSWTEKRWLHIGLDANEDGSRNCIDQKNKEFRLVPVE